MQITIYSKSACPLCVQAKQLLNSKGLEYEEQELSPERMTYFLADYPEARQMPQIFIDDQRVGGLAGLQAALKQLGV